MAACPNINSPEWKKLVDQFTEEGAWRAFIANGNEIPNIASDINEVKSSVKGLVESDSGYFFTPLKTDLTQEIKDKFFNVSVSSYEINNQRRYDIFVESTSSSGPELSKLSELSEEQRKYKQDLIDYIKVKGLKTSDLVSIPFTDLAMTAIGTITKLEKAQNANGFSASELKFLVNTLPTDHVAYKELQNKAKMLFPDVENPTMEHINTMLDFYVNNPDRIAGIHGDVGSTLSSLVRTSKGRLSNLEAEHISDLLTGYHKNVSSRMVEEGYLTQDKVIERLLSTVNQIAGINPETNRYIDAETGEDVANRPTDLSKKAFEKNKTEEEIREIQEDPNNVMAAELGTEGHAVAGYYIQEAAENFSNLSTRSAEKLTLPEEKHINKNQRDKIRKGVYSLMRSLNEEQRRINPNGKAVLMPEVLLYDKRRSTAGTSDLITVFSDGSASIHDYKFVRFPEITVQEGNTYRKVVVEDHLDLYKTKSYNLQLSEYSRILRSVYDIQHLRQTRIIPVEVKFAGKKDKATGKYMFTGLKSLDMLNENKAYIDPIPVAKEFTGISNVDAVLSQLYDRRDKLENQLKKSYGNEMQVSRIKDNITLTNKSIKELLVHKTIDALSANLTGIIKNVRENVEEMDLAELVDAMESISFYADNLSDLEELIDSNDKLSPEEKQANKEKLQNYVGNTHSVRRIIQTNLEIKLKELDPDIDKVVRKLTVGDKWAYTSEIDNPVIHMARKYLNEAHDQATAKTNDLIKEAKAWKKKLVDAFGSNVLETYKRIINPKTGDLIPKFDGQFFRQQKEAQKNGDVKFFKKNYKITEEGKKRMAEDRAAKKKELLSMFTEGSREYNYRMSRWEAENDMLNSDEAWLKSWVRAKYMELSNPEAHYSAEYKALQSTPVLLDFYEWYRAKNSEFNEMVTDKIPERFIANVHKDIVDTLAQDGNVFKAVSTGIKSFVNSMQIRQNDTMKIDPDSKIPLLYLDDFSYYNAETNKFEKQEGVKSLDLIYNIILFGNSVYTKHHLESIEHVIKGLREYMPRQTVYKTNKFGRVVSQEGNREAPEMIHTGDQTAIEIFDAMVRSRMYGETMQDEDRVFQVGGKTYSRNKVLTKLMSFLSVNALAGNYVSAVGGGINAYMNSYFSGAGGQYYTISQMKKAEKLRVTNHKTFHLATQFFRIEKEHWAKKEASKLSATFISRHATYDKFYFMQQNLDEFTADQVTIAMMQNYGIDPENPNKVRKLKLLPEGTKSLYDLMEVKDDQIHIEGLSDKAFSDFRDKANFVVKRIKGTNTADDLTYIQTKVWGRAVMHFRNWIQPMLAERFGTTKYVPGMDEWVTGRYTSLVVDIQQQKILPALLKLTANMIPFVNVYKGTENSLKGAYEQFQKNNPDKKISYQEFKLIKQSQLRAAATELRMMILTGMALMALGADWDDDGVPNWKEIPGFGPLYSVLDRTQAELTFFVVPSSFQEILKSPVPLMRLMLTAGKFIENTGDEIRDRLLGENDVSLITGKSKDPAEAWHYGFRLFPFTGPAIRFADELMSHYEDENR